MATLSEIERLAKEYSDARELLKSKHQYLEDEITAAKRQYLPQIRRAVEKAAEKQEALRQAIEESSDLFRRPKTFIFHGIRLGYQKGKGEIAWENTEQVVKLIEKHFPEQAETLIQITKRPLKTALAQMSVQDLKKIGVTVIETGDEVFIKPTDSEIDRLINALLRDEEIDKAA